MAVYDYYCKDCGLDYEVSRGINEVEVIPNCAELSCGKPLMRRFTGVAVAFKGEGFHINDKKGGNAKGNKTQK